MTRTHTVQSGDTLSAIALRLGTTVDALHAANRDQVPDRDLIFPGQVLVVPGSGAEDAATAAATTAASTPTIAAGAPAPVAAVAPATGTSRAMIRPVDGEEVSSGFGANEPFRGGVRHDGIDYPRPAGTPIKAAAAGTVVHAGPDVGGAGISVTIDHGGGVHTRYAHQSKVEVVVGQRVAQGELIGRVGTTGNSTGNHLHFAVLEGGTHMTGGRTVDPGPYLRGERLLAGA